MYCRNCGHKVEEGDKFCSVCGAKTVEENDTTASAKESSSESFFDSSKPLFEPFDFNKIDLALGIDSKSESKQKQDEPKSSTTEEFDWNIHSFPGTPGTKVEKTEDIDFNWSMPVDEPEPAPTEKPAAPDASAASPIARQEPGLSEHQAPPAPKEPPKPSTSLEEELFGNSNDKKDGTQKQPEEMDKFFTFHKKNEDFQRLLDQEYEKIKSGNILSEEMDSAVMASEEKFASRKPEDPMEELFASEGVVKGYQPKPIETDVLERIEAAEAEKRIKEESARLVEEEKARARKEAEEKARQEAEAKARKEAEERARQEAEERARKEAEERVRQEAEAKARKEAEEKARQEAEEKARREAEEKAKQEAEAARLRLQEDAKRAADARAAEEAAEREKERMAARAGAAAAMKDLEAEEQRIKAETEARLAEQAARIQEQIAKQEAEVARLQAEAAKAEAAKREAEAAKQKAFEEMQKAQQEAQQQQQGQAAEEVPVKTKAVNKAEILAGIATATEMVERDKAFAAAEAAKAKEEAESIELPGFLGHLDELEEEEPEQQPIDIFEELATVEAEQTHAAEQSEDKDKDILSLEDLLVEEEPHKEPELSEPKPEEPKQEPVREPAKPEEARPPQPEPEKKEHKEEQTAATEEKRSSLASSDTAEQKAVSKKDVKDAEEDDDEDDEKESKGGAGRVILKICLVILVILLALEVAGVVIKVALPDSEAAKLIDEQLNKVIQMVTGDDVEYRVLAAEEEVRTQPMQDKTELIEAEMGKNKDGNIAHIEYNADLRYDAERKYENTDLNLTQELTDVAWYKDASDEQVYFDQAIVGAIIAYDSQRMNLINYGDESVMNLVQKGTDLYKELKASAKTGDGKSMSLLQIGEIRQAGTSYFVWVSEKIGSTETKRIYEMTPEGEMMKLTAGYEL